RTFATGSGPSAIVTGDFNGDGKTDLVTANALANTVVLLGDGSGNFGASTEFAVGTKPIAVITGDFNGDGKTDLAVVNQTSTYFGYTPTALVIADINGDGKPDLITADGSGAAVALGNGDGTFQSSIHYNGGNGGSGVVCADINGDGRLDVAVANTSSNTVTV